MEYDRKEERRRRDLEKALAAKKKLEEKKAELDRKARAAKSRLLATTRHETWHRMRLAWLDREAGYDGEMASARVWLRNLPISDYLQALAPFAHAMPDATNIQIEVAAVRDNLADWTAKGDALLLERAKRDYSAEVAGFRQWQEAHPGKTNWRSKPATRNQLFLISRTAAAHGVEMPRRLNRGEAHDWLEVHGGNRRLSDDADSSSTASDGATHSGVEAATAQLDGTVSAQPSELRGDES